MAATKKLSLTVTFSAPSDLPDHLADAELTLTGPLAGLTLGNISVWRAYNDVPHVSFCATARTGREESYRCLPSSGLYDPPPFLRPTDSAHKASINNLETHILREYKKWARTRAKAPAMTPATA